MWGSELQYRAIEGTNTKVRRLAYLTAIISILGRNALNEQVLLAKLADWSKRQESNLRQYWSQTGEVTSTRRNSAGSRYLHLANQIGLIVPISGVYRATRKGMTLYFVCKDFPSSSNPFYLSNPERLLYTNILLDQDGDYLLTIVEFLIEKPEASLALLQQEFQRRLLQRLEWKSRLPGIEEPLRHKIVDRIRVIRDWDKPLRYAEHLVPPRLNWLLDLGILAPESFREHRYVLTEGGLNFFKSLPIQNGHLEVKTSWLAHEFWQLMPAFLLNMTLLDWKQVEEGERYTLCATLLEKTFRSFQISFVPRVSLSQALTYMCAKLIIEHRIAVSPKELLDWLSFSRCTFNGKQIEVHLSPLENVSYLLAIPTSGGSS